jgi:hypothetical protein
MDHQSHKVTPATHHKATSAPIDTMKTLDDLVVLAELLPRDPSESGIAWVSRARGEGILNEDEWVNACKMIKAYAYLFIRK